MLAVPRVFHQNAGDLLLNRVKSMAETFRMTLCRGERNVIVERPDRSPVVTPAPMHLRRRVGAMCTEGSSTLDDQFEIVRSSPGEHDSSTHPFMEGKYSVVVLGLQTIIETYSGRLSPDTYGGGA
ncbi:hypothetical protein LJR034_008434 [Caballeronia sp. LjRoot34]|uniref:hypothetical protein n=1 Tax=Caballeronia sp. LjRoot34 TaxID=3342325 RepID=UPI003ECFCABB